MKTEAPRAVGYLRVSSEEQVENHSLAAQRHEIERFCQRAGYRLIAFYADEGVSAHTEKVEARPQQFRRPHQLADGAGDGGG